MCAFVGLEFLTISRVSFIQIFVKFFDDDENFCIVFRTHKLKLKPFSKSKSLLGHTSATLFAKVLELFSMKCLRRIREAGLKYKSLLLF